MPLRRGSRALAGIFALCALAGCTTQQTLPAACPIQVAAATQPVHSPPAPQTGCPSSLADQPQSQLAAVRQAGSQTRTVGVPRGFLIAMIVLFVLMAG